MANLFRRFAKIPAAEIPFPNRENTHHRFQGNASSKSDVIPARDRRFQTEYDPHIAGRIDESCKADALTHRFARQIQHRD